ncbi:hypothetical protein FNV43_RR15680 [Rhamnella rubrinervis]|uniref:Pistil-specific extensin-like protein n=1 Tax=Rhamnella rubrinervis TaxID=2594499 RepID=A0A8K0E9I6_9ROSA|nr:hypothetical protein FNV43_RR15680 [Rhamnella rubrinervis]
MEAVPVVVVLILGASILMGCTDLAVASDHEAGKIHIGGSVLCQDCTQGWNQWAHGGKPIKGCKVSTLCMDERRRVMHYGSDTTDEAGQFQMSINKVINGKPIKKELCFVRLVSSPDKACNVFTDFGGGRSGVRLTQPTYAYGDSIKFTISPFYFTTPMCDEPDTTHANDQSDPDDHAT